MIPDDFFRHPHPYYPRPVRERLNAVWRSAQRFNFSAQASTVAGRLAFQAPELVINHRQFAISPYPTTYVEFDARAFFDEALKAGVAMVNDGDQRDLRVGYLIDGSDVYTFSTNGRPIDAADGIPERGTREGEAGMSLAPFFYRTAPPGSVLETSTLDLGEDVVYFGSKTTGHLRRADDPKHLTGKLVLLLGTATTTTAAQRAKDDILACHEVVPLHAFFGADMKGWWGDIRNLWTLLLWLNQPARCHFTDVPPARRITRGKLHTYTAFRTVEIELGKVRSIRRAYLLGAPRTPPRDHPVRGNFHHRGGLTQGCGHDWPLEPDVHGVWECSKCQRRRWWVKAHRRGDETRGVIVHDYDIVTPQEGKAA